MKDQGRILLSIRAWAMELDGCLSLSFFLILLYLCFAESINDKTVTDGRWEREPSNIPFFNRSTFLLRKCCRDGQMFTTDTHASKGSNQQCVNCGTPAHFFGQQYNNIANITSLKIDSGFPRQCSSGGSIVLEPNSNPADHFYPLASGHLVVPHRFWFFQPDHYCMEDFFLDDNFENVRHSAIICLDRIEPFPATALDHRGRLNFDFLPGVETSSALTKLSGQKVIRKCCDINQVYSVANQSCVPKQGYATPYFDDLQNSEFNSEDLFFHISLLDCLDQLQTTIFAVSPDSGRLRIKMEETDENWQEVTNYCVDDFVLLFEDKLPEIVTLANYCPPQFLGLNLTVDFVPNQGIISFPKCCQADFIVEDNRCRPLQLEDKVNTITEIDFIKTLQSFLDSNISAGILTPNVTLSCGLSTAYPLLSTEKRVLAKPSFNNDGNNSLVFALHYYVEKYWDFNVTLKPFCVDLKLFRTIDEVYFEPTVWHCTSASHVSGHYPIFLYISSAALVATFIIYFIIPASSGRFVTSLGGSRKQLNLKGGPLTMAKMLTGRNLLCHIACLIVTFISLAIGQQEIVVPGEGTCAALGYVIYAASMGSFTWLTVICFDYCWMFRGSFNVSDTFIFIPYSVFGWGVPIITLATALLAQFGNKLVHFLTDVNPNMGLIRCWFAGEKSVLVFFYIPVSFLLALNIALFLSLLFNPNLMNCTKKKSNLGPQLRINHKGTNSSRKQEDLKKAIKLFFIAGIPWVFEIISCYFIALPSFVSTKSTYLFEASNLLNSLRGVLVFITFVLFQRDVRRYLWLQLKKIRSCFQDQSGSRAEIESKDHPHVSSSFSTLVSSSSQRTLQSQLSTILAGSIIDEPISFTSGESEAVYSSPPHVEVDEITYL